MPPGSKSRADPHADLPDFAASSLGALAKWANARSLPPVDQWHPAHCGSIDIRIAADGRWFHNGGEITRPAMVRLFSTVLRREADGSHVLVTPGELLSIIVDDAAFVAVEARVEGACSENNDSDNNGPDSSAQQQVALRLNTGDLLLLDAAHPLVLRDGPAGRLPYAQVRGAAGRMLEARLARPVYYALAELVDADGMLWSCGVRHPLGDMAGEMTGDITGDAP